MSRLIGYRTTTRIPDLMVLTEELVTALSGAKRSVVMPDMPPPVLVVEIVSPGTQNEERDYRYKRSEYAARSIAEYWIPHSALPTGTSRINNEAVEVVEALFGELSQ